MLNAVLIAAALFLVLLNGFFVAAEFALARARTTRLEAKAEEGSRAAALGARQVDDIDRYLAACQLGITLASLGLGWIAEPAFGALIEPALEAVGIGHAPSLLIAGVIAFVIITFLHVVVGELAPKTVAIRRAEGTTLVLARPLEGFRRLFQPAIYVLNGAGNWLVRRFGIEPASELELSSTPEDLQRLILQSEEGGALDADEAEMLKGVFGLEDSIARDVMTPRPEVAFLGADIPLGESLRLALDTRHSRFPVLDHDDQNVIGVVHLSDLARGMIEDNGDLKVADVTGPTVFVPETRPLDEVLSELQRRRTSLACVLDEYGELAGLVSVEDVIEEIVGEIHDERDRLPPVDMRPDGRLIVGGHVPLEDLRDHGVEIVDGDVTSIGGLVFSRLGRLPRTGDSILLDDYVLTVEATRGTRILLVAIEGRRGKPEEPDEPERPEQPETA